MTATDFIRKNSTWRVLRHQRSAVVMVHLRYATHGSPQDNRNNHPFVSRDGRFHLVHNGVLTNHADVDERYQLARDGECDSESILRLLEKLGEPRKGLSACLAEFEGSLAVAVYDSKADLTWLTCNGGRPLWLFKLAGRRGWLWASVPTVMHRALARVYGKSYGVEIEVQLPLAPDVLHVISARGKLIGVEPVALATRRETLIDE
jgi:glucosamine 6-phosphate synthetase-like amidotransferase/phosphosugar isomerase protein